MQTGEYDGVSASGDATERLIAGGEVSPVNVDLIPNYADVFDDLKLQKHNSVDGVPYGVPHGRGANLLVFNTDTYTTATRLMGRDVRSSRRRRQGRCRCTTHRSTSPTRRCT